MPTLLVNFLPSIASTLIISVLSSYFTVRFALKQFYSQKWWEKKAAFYTQLLGSIAVLQVQYNNIYSVILHEESDFKDNDDTWQKKFSNAHGFLGQAIIEGAFILSDEIILAILNILNQVNNYNIYLSEKGAFESGCFEYLNKIFDSINQAVLLVKKTGLNDLKIK